MLHPLRLLRLSDEGLPAVVASSTRSWRPSLVIGREFLLFESLPCKGVAWHELTGFARLQAARLSPYQRSGACAAVRNGTLMLWFWDADELNSALEKLALPAEGLQFIAEPLMHALDKDEGPLRLACHSGTDVLLLDKGAIVRSRWEARTVAGHPVPRLLSRPWARNRLESTLHGGADGLSITSLRRHGLAILATVAVVACGARTAYWGGSLLAGDKQLAALESTTAAQVERLGTVRQLQLRSQADLRWVQGYEDISGSLQVSRLLDALEQPLAAQRVVIKELEVRGDEARLMISSVGADLDLPALIATLKGISGLDDVRLRQSVDPSQAEFSARAAGFRRDSPKDPTPRT
jgi:hypothetical protein